ncbi:hypothetical protein GCM10023074_63590 [Microbispora amethystogenes]|uniref:Uncharacterized protein n=1 Tax=Microbispora amethystogenes TaxID=1427754 RepID=A0ABQ4FJY1_9ACTN|nr:hypothetical protein Mam01_52980 [Microbispora amethystogenes]
MRRGSSYRSRGPGVPRRSRTAPGEGVDEAVAGVEAYDAREHQARRGGGEERAGGAWFERPRHHQHDRELPGRGGRGGGQTGNAVPHQAAPEEPPAKPAKAGQPAMSRP